MKLLLCDDHRLFLEPLATAMAGHGHEVVTATNPVDAVRAVQATDPDVCVLDVHFRSGTGLDAARAIHRRFPRTRVLMLSASVDPDIVSACMDLGAAGFIRKDRPVADLLEAMERVAQGHVVVDSGRPGADSRAGRQGEPMERRRLGTLTPREREVLRLLVDAHDTRAIAASLNISASTARSHVQNVLMKLGVHSRLQAVAMVARSGTDLLASAAPGARAPGAGAQGRTT